MFIYNPEGLKDHGVNPGVSGSIMCVIYHGSLEAHERMHLHDKADKAGSFSIGGGAVKGSRGPS